MRHHKSFLKWAGGKYSCLDKIIPAFPQAKRFIEPFTGSASVFLNTDFQQNILAEINLDLIHIYNQIKLEAKEFVPFCKEFFIPENNKAETYYALRARFNASKDIKERAALFLYLNKHGFNGLCRYNKQGIYNVPFGFYKKPYFPEMEMYYFQEKSKRAEFVHSDYEKTFSLAEPGDLIYCDPPYTPLSKTAKFTTYAGNGFLDAEQVKLAKLAMEAASRNIIVIISNHDVPLTREYYKEAEIQSFPVRRHISCMADNRQSVKELLAIFR